MAHEPITSWTQPEEIELSQTFHDWLIQTNKIRWNLNEINPSANTVSANTANLNTVNIGPGNLTVTNTTTNIDSDNITIGADSGDALTVNSTMTVQNPSIFQQDISLTGDMTASGNIDADTFTGNGTGVLAVDYNKLINVPDFADYLTKPVQYADLGEELKQSFIPSGTIILCRNSGAVPLGWKPAAGNVNDHALKVTTNSTLQESKGDIPFSHLFNSQHQFQVHAHLTGLQNMVIENTGNNLRDVLRQMISIDKGNLAVNNGGSVYVNNWNTTSVALTASQIPAHFHYSVNSGQADGTNVSSSNYTVRRTGDDDNDHYDLQGTTSVANAGRTSTVGSGGGHSHRVYGSTPNHSHGLSGQPNLSIQTVDLKLRMKSSADTYPKQVKLYEDPSGTPISNRDNIIVDRNDQAPGTTRYFDSLFNLRHTEVRFIEKEAHVGDNIPKW